MLSIDVSELQTRCLELLDTVANTDKTVLILDQGRVVAKLIPPPATPRYPQDELRGSVTILGDVIAPAIPENEP